MRVFERQSEKYSKFGNMSAQGIKRLLGTPTIDQLQTVIREAVQNSWDAAAGREKPQFVVHLRQMGEQEMETVREVLFADYVPEDAPDCLSGFLEQERPWVLELSDIGTSGLGGPTDASVITREDEDSDFVDFVRNVGTPRDTVHGGGTYGYGKSSLYSLSRWGTIVIDSQTRFKGRDERRLIACRVASSFIVESGVNRGKYTGRHWWGKYDHSGEGLDPVTGDTAESVARTIGALEREEKDYGTSIMILDPVMDDEPEKVMNAIQRALLWNFWPKMVTYPGKGASMAFRTILNGVDKELPDIDDCPPLDIFATALRNLKAGEGIHIDCLRPQKPLGLLRIEKEPKGLRLPGFGPQDDDMFPEAACHVALMRPAELVVKYLDGNLLPPAAEWGGVFVCSDEHEVEHAFAMSEPPAHDDWCPKSMPKGNAKTFVRVALRRIREHMELVAGTTQIVATGQGAELARVSGRMGALLAGAIGDGLSPSRRGGKRGSSPRKPKSLRIVNLEGYGPAEWDEGEVLAWFSFEVESPDSREIILSGHPKVFIDGENSDDAPDGTRPEIRAWLNKDEELMGTSERLIIDSSDASTVWVGITIPADCAVSFTPEIIES